MMPPQSRGLDNDFPDTLSPGLYPPFDTTPPTSELGSDQRTPTGPIPNGYADEDYPIILPVNEEEEEEDDDADFQSHYSQENKSDVSTSSSSDEDDEEQEDGVDSRPSLMSRSTTSLHGPNAFAPPFYNRPPTPLPPSPSLTSLLRPPFSTTTSRPSTPDTSDNETPNDTEAAVAKSARTATTVPRASPQVPTYEYYGFVLYLASSLAFLIYLLWSYLPSPFLHQLGIYYYPNRWWALAIPAYLVMLLGYIYVALACYNTEYLTLPMNSIEGIVDEAANVAVIDSKGRVRKGGSEKMKPGAATAQTVGNSHRRVEWRNLWNEGTDAVMDVPVGGVCEVLYGDNREEEEILTEWPPDYTSERRLSSWSLVSNR